MEIIVKKDIKHYNRALNKNITTRKQYNEEMKRQGMVSQEKGDYLAEQAKAKLMKPYKLNNETEKFLKGVKMSSRDGKVKLSGRELAYMEKIGVSFNKPKERGIEGGFE